MYPCLELNSMTTSGYKIGWDRKDLTLYPLWHEETREVELAKLTTALQRIPTDYEFSETEHLTSQVKQSHYLREREQRQRKGQRSIPSQFFKTLGSCPGWMEFILYVFHGAPQLRVPETTLHGFT